MACCGKPKDETPERVKQEHVAHPHPGGQGPFNASPNETPRAGAPKRRIPSEHLSAAPGEVACSSSDAEDMPHTQARPDPLHRNSRTVVVKKKGLMAALADGVKNKMPGRKKKPPVDIMTRNPVAGKLSEDQRIAHDQAFGWDSFIQKTTNDKGESILRPDASAANGTSADDVRVSLA